MAHFSEMVKPFSFTTSRLGGCQLAFLSSTKPWQFSKSFTFARNPNPLINRFQLRLHHFVQYGSPQLISNLPGFSLAYNDVASLCWHGPNSGASHLSPETALTASNLSTLLAIPLDGFFYNQGWPCLPPIWGGVQDYFELSAACLFLQATSRCLPINHSSPNKWKQILTCHHLKPLPRGPILPFTGILTPHTIAHFTLLLLIPLDPV